MNKWLAVLAALMSILVVYIQISDQRTQERERTLYKEASLSPLRTATAKIGQIRALHQSTGDELLPYQGVYSDDQLEALLVEVERRGKKQ
jgi:hypothetical protein